VPALFVIIQGLAERVRRREPASGAGAEAGEGVVR
jgi:hypothetical protein